jgi:hypothetical protein
MPREPAGSARGEPGMSGEGSAGPPPLRPFGLVLHRDGSWTHRGRPIENRRIREKFDRSVRYLPEERKYVVQVGRFRGEIEVEEAGFFVRDVDPWGGNLGWISRTVDLASLRVSCSLYRERGSSPEPPPPAAQAERRRGGRPEPGDPAEGQSRPMPPLLREGRERGSQGFPPISAT